MNMEASTARPTNEPLVVIKQGHDTHLLAAGHGMVYWTINPDVLRAVVSLLHSPDPDPDFSKTHPGWRRVRDPLLTRVFASAVDRWTEALDDFDVRLTRLNTLTQRDEDAAEFAVQEKLGAQ